MAWLLDLYASQPFWVWLTLGVVLLGIEAMTSTEWLLWPAVSAGILALITALWCDLGLPIEAGLFAALTVVLTLVSRRLVKKANPSDAPDINNQSLRLIGKEAQVVEAFVNGRGRVFVSGSEWLAVGPVGQILAGQVVVVEDVDGTLLKVRLL